MSGGFDRQALAVVDAAYRLCDETAGWLTGVLQAAAPLLDRGEGVFGVTYGVSSGAFAPTSDVAHTSGGRPELGRGGTEAAASTPPALAREVFVRAAPIATACGLAADLAVHEIPGYRPLDSLAAHGLRDCLGVIAYDPSDVGLLLFAPAKTTPSIDAGTLERWRHVRAHLLAGLRLHRALEDEAILDASGRVVHAEGSARAPRALEALRAHARRIDRARGAPGRADPQGALQAWAALVRGRWSLVDRFESDGRRYLVARRNDPDVAAPRELSRRERQVLAYAALGYSNKHIAYTLGLAPSTVSSHLCNAMRRVGASSLSSVAAVWRSMPPHEPT